MSASLRAFRLRLTLLTAGLCGFAFAALADGGRDYAGNYDLRDRVEQDGNCTVTFLVMVQNVSGSDAPAVTLRLLSRLEPGRSFLEFAPTALQDRAAARFSASVELPCGELASWDGGFTPLLVVDGSPLQQVELVRGPVTEELPQ